MGAPVQFDPWAVLQELRRTPAETAAIASTRHQKSCPSPAAIAAVAANQPNAAIAAVAARGGVENREHATAPPADWREALAQLETRPRPESIPAERWTQAVADASYLVHDWGQALFRCGWTLADLFSAHQEKPLTRFDAMGLGLLLQGRKIGPIDQDRIAIRQLGGAVLHFRRPRVSVAETVMLWKLRD
jgi:hypothetical protein